MQGSTWIPSFSCPISPGDQSDTCSCIFSVNDQNCIISPLLTFLIPYSYVLYTSIHSGWIWCQKQTTRPDGLCGRAYLSSCWLVMDPLTGIKRRWAACKKCNEGIQPLTPQSFSFNLHFYLWFTLVSMIDFIGWFHQQQIGHYLLKWYLYV